MRQIRFRGMDEDGKWWEGDLVHFPPGLDVSETGIQFWVQPGNRCDCQDVDPNTVGQWTGLVDKNGTKIWEGDTVIWGDITAAEYWRVAVVEFDPDLRFRVIDHPSGGISVLAGGIFHYGALDTDNWLEVNGNIHETKGGE